MVVVCLGMRLPMDYLRVIIFVCFFVYIDAQTATPKLTLPSPIYYVNQSISMSCDSGISTDILSVAVTINKTEVLFAITCEYVNGRWSLTKIGIGTGDATDNCDTLPVSGKVNLVIRRQLTGNLVSSTAACVVKYLDGRSQMSISDSIANAFSDAYIAPTMLEFDKFEFDDNVPVVNKKIRAHCISHGGHPASRLVYEVRNTSDSVVYSTTEVKDGAAELHIDRHVKYGFKVACRDEVHSEGKILLIKQNCSGTGSDVCKPWFLEISSDDLSLQKPLLNPNYTNLLKCAVNRYPADKINYSWTRGGQVTSATDTYTLDPVVVEEGTKENVTCTASLDKYGNVTITWEITWTPKATTTTVATSAATSSATSASTAIGVGVGVGVAVVVIAVVVGIILYKKKKDNSARYQNTPPAPASVTVNKPEKPKKPSSQTTNGGHPAYSKNDDRIIYAELDQHTLGNKQPQPAKPTPKYTQDVVYAEIDPNKTRKLANKNQ